MEKLAQLFIGSSQKQLTSEKRAKPNYETRSAKT